MMGNHRKQTAKVLFALGVIISIAVVCYGIETEKSDVIDLTRPLGPGCPSFSIIETPVDDTAPGLIPERRFVFAYEPGLTETTTLVLPHRWVEDGATLDDITVSSLIMPTVVIDATDLAAGSEEFALDAGTLMRYETFAGEIPEGAAVLVALRADNTGTRSGIPAAPMPAGYPGLAPDAVTFLVDKRHVSMIGIDTPGIDPSGREDNEAAMVLAKSGGLALVNLWGVDSLPSRGGVLVLSPLAIDGADTVPARVLVFVPKVPLPPVE